MLTYFKYIELNLIKKKTTWVAAGIFWLYMSLILIIVPAILHLNPDTLWTSTVIDIKSFTLIILSILCAVVTVVIFRDPLEDGSELIIISKPINRIKLISVKIVCYLFHVIMVLLVSMIIMAFMYCFGRKTATHTNGVDFATIPKMEGGLFLGGLVIILLFGGIAIIVNGVFNKIGILIITIGIAVVLNIINTVIPFIATTPDKYISRVYKNEMDSSRYIDVDGKFHNAVYALNNYTDSSNNYYGTEYYADQGNKNTSGAFPSYINVGSQLSEIFNAFTTNKKFDETANAFGEDYTYRYSLRTTEASNEITPILKYNLAPEQKFNLDPKTNPFLPNIYMKVRTKDYQQQVSYRVFGPSTTDLLLYSFLGMKDDAVAYYRPNTVNLLKYIGRVKFYSREDVYNLPPKDIPEIMANIGTCSPSLHLGAEPTLIQQFEVMWRRPYAEKKELGLGFRSIIAADLLGESPDFNPVEQDIGLNTYFYNGKNLGINIDVDKMKQPGVSQSVIDQGNDAIDAAYVKLLSYIKMSLERQLWEEINKYFTEHQDAEFNDETMINLLDGNVSSSNNVAYLNSLIDEMTYIDDTPFNFLNTTPTVFLNGYSAPTYETITGPKADSAFHWFYRTINGTSCLEDLYLYNAHRYYTPSSVTLFWSIFSILLFAGAVVIYLKTDFK